MMLAGYGFRFFLATLVLLARCGGGGGSDGATVAVVVDSPAPASAQAYGDVPEGLPSRLAVGLIEEPDVTWMRDSGVAWALRYHFFTKGWRDNWGYGSWVNGEWGQDLWWDASDSAGIDTKSFNRYAEWLGLWNLKAGKRWVLWQIPLGNFNHLNVANNGGSREGFQDNRAEYLFGNGTDHLRKFADAGVIALLFGPGQENQSFYANDYYTDDQLFMLSRAGAILNGGGVPIAITGR